MSDWLRGLDAWLTREPASWDDVPADDGSSEEGEVFMTEEDLIRAGAAAMGRRGGLAGRGKTSPAKKAAARRNGMLGGRPKRIPLVDAAGILIGWGARVDGKPDRRMIR